MLTFNKSKQKVGLHLNTFSLFLDHVSALNSCSVSQTRGFRELERPGLNSDSTIHHVTLSCVFIYSHLWFLFMIKWVCWLTLRTFVIILVWYGSGIPCHSPHFPDLITTKDTKIWNMTFIFFIETLCNWIVCGHTSANTYMCIYVDNEMRSLGENLRCVLFLLSCR